jgi:hypothetical protein
LVRVYFVDKTMQRITVYPNEDSFDNGLYKRTGGLCGSWKNQLDPSEPYTPCNLYYKEGGVDKCLNNSAEVETSEKFKNYWR